MLEFLKAFFGKKSKTIPVCSTELQRVLQKSIAGKQLGYIENPAKELEDDRDAFRKMLRNGSIRATQELRVDKTLRKRFVCENNPEVEDFMYSFSNLKTALKWLCRDGFGQGLGCIRVDFFNKKLYHVMPERITKIVDTDKKTYWATINEYNTTEKITRYNHILFVYNEVEHLLGYGEGYLHWAYWEAKKALLLLETALDSLDSASGSGTIFAEGVDLSKIHSNKVEDLAEFLDTELDRLVKMKKTGAVVYDKDGKIDLLNPNPFPPALYDMYQDALLNIIKIIQGASLNSGGENTAGGNRAMGDIAEEQTVDKSENDAEELTQPVTLFAELCWNYLGNPGEKPIITLENGQRMLTPDERRLNLDTARFLFEQGYEIPDEELSNKLGNWQFTFVGKPEPEPAKNPFFQYQVNEPKKKVPKQYDIMNDFFEEKAKQMFSIENDFDTEKFAEKFGLMYLHSFLRGSFSLVKEKKYDAIGFSVEKDFWNMTLEEASKSILERYPDLGLNYKMVSEIAKNNGFAIVNSTDKVFTQKIQGILADFVLEGGAKSSFSEFSEVMKRTNDWRHSYTEVVYRTNLATAYSEGRQREANAIGDGKAMWEYSAVNDKRSRHMPIDGLRAYINNPIWSLIKEPLDYNCRCVRKYIPSAIVEREGYTENVDKYESNIQKVLGTISSGFKGV